MVLVFLKKKFWLIDVLFTFKPVQKSDSKSQKNIQLIIYFFFF